MLQCFFVPDGTARLRIVEPPSVTRKRCLGRITKESIRIGRLLFPEAIHRPRTRGDCPDSRPCGIISCRHNLWMDVNQTGGIILRESGVEPEDAEHSCSLDLAQQGGMTLEEVGGVMSICRERVRQIENAALAKLGLVTLRSLL